MADLKALQERWTHLYHDYLPSLAKARNPIQPSWPVHLDHCFARVVLDNAVGLDRPWTAVVKQPAVKNMTAKQLENTIDLAEKVATGEADLIALNERSLRLRGKKRKGEAASMGSPAKKNKRSTGTISSYFLPSLASPTCKARPGEQEGIDLSSPEDHEPKERANEPDMLIQLKRVADSNLTPFRKQMLRMLCQIPRGQYSTYQTMSDYVTKSSHKTCARAVGNAMRNNPFAPEVPCHRILSHDGTLGGFGGYWGENGKFANKKHQLLFEEGVRFDSKGKVKGPPFRDFSG